ncbi:MAG: hypothetical protein AAF411_04765 [Myxococcota bacterium]
MMEANPYPRGRRDRRDGLRKRACRIGFALLSMVLSACGNDPQESVEFEVGTGSWRFEALSDGDSVELIRGAQGGWHIWMAARTSDLRDGDLVRFFVGPADGELSGTELNASFDPPRSDGFRHYVGWTGFVNDAACAVGTLYRLRAALVRNGEEVAASERDVMVDPGADPPAPCLESE